MLEEKTKSFIESFRKYFEKTTGETPIVGVPRFLESGGLESLDYTGIIGITGKARGAICFSASTVFLETLAEKIFQIEPNRDVIMDLVGEIANTLAGNAQVFLPDQFEISLPVVLQGSPAEMQIKRLNEPIFCVPVFWRDEEAMLTIGISS